MPKRNPHDEIDENDEEYPWDIRPKSEDDEDAFDADGDGADSDEDAEDFDDDDEEVDNLDNLFKTFPPLMEEE